MRIFLFTIVILFLCTGCRSSRQETSSSLTDIQLEELISKRLTQFHIGNKITDIHRRDSATITITEYNAPDSTGHQSKKSQTIISTGSQMTTTQQEIDTTTTQVTDSISKTTDIHQSTDEVYKTTPVPWYSGFEPYIVLIVIAAVLYLLKRLKIIKL